MTVLYDFVYQFFVSLEFKRNEGFQTSLKKCSPKNGALTAILPQTDNQAALPDEQFKNNYINGL